MGQPVGHPFQQSVVMQGLLRPKLYAPVMPHIDYLELGACRLNSLWTFL